jgi:chromosome segregation ATPase
MKNTSRFLVALIVLIVAASPHAEQSKSDEASRKEKLMADENMSLTHEVAQCRSEIEKQKKLLEQYKQENQKITQKAVSDANTIRNLQNELSKCWIELKTYKKQLEQCQQMVDMKDVPALCRDKVEKLKKQLEQCTQAKEKLDEKEGEKATALLNKIPQDLQNENVRLTNENAALQKKIEDLEKKPKDANDVKKKH